MNPSPLSHTLIRSVFFLPPPANLAKRHSLLYNHYRLRSTLLAFPSLSPCVHLVCSSSPPARMLSFFLWLILLFTQLTSFLGFVHNSPFARPFSSYHIASRSRNLKTGTQELPSSLPAPMVLSPITARAVPLSSSSEKGDALRHQASNRI